MNLKDPRTNWKHILIWVILAFIAGGWILWYTSYFNKEITSLTEPLEIEEPEKVVKDKIANWETYKNEEYKYEIKYPKDWYAYTADPADVYFQPEKEIPGVIIPGPHANAFEIEVNLISPDISLVQAIKNKLPEGMKFTQEEVNIGGIDGLRIKTICEGVGCGAPEWFVIKDNYLYHFDSNLGYCETFNEVLSTFKFIRVEDETANWKTYRNEEYGYEMKYPAEWNYKEEIPQPQNFGIKISFTDTEGNYILSIQSPIPEIGYELSIVTKTEKIKIQNSDKFLIRKILEPRPGAEEEFGMDINNLILVSWNEDNWGKSGQISLGYEEANDPNIQVLDQMLSTFRFLE